MVARWGWGQRNRRRRVRQPAVLSECARTFTAGRTDEVRHLRAHGDHELLAAAQREGEVEEGAQAADAQAVAREVLHGRHEDAGRRGCGAGFELRGGEGVQGAWVVVNASFFSA